MPHFYLTPKQDDFNQIPELQVCIAEALYDAEAVLSNPAAFKAEVGYGGGGSAVLGFVLFRSDKFGVPPRVGSPLCHSAVRDAGRVRTRPKSQLETWPLFRSSKTRTELNATTAA